MKFNDKDSTCVDGELIISAFLFQEEGCSLIPWKKMPIVYGICIDLAHSNRPHWLRYDNEKLRNSDYVQTVEIIEERGG